MRPTRNFTRPRTSASVVRGSVSANDRMSSRLTTPAQPSPPVVPLGLYGLFTPLPASSQRSLIRPHDAVLVLARSDAGSAPRRKWALVVGVERPVHEAIGRALGFDGYEVVLAATGNQALARLDGLQGRFEPDLVVLDLRESGAALELIRAIRAAGLAVPILILTASSDLGHHVAALDLGADDYVVEPFALEEVLARIRALLRRGSLPRGAVLRFADLELDPNSHEVRRGGELVECTRTEFALLELFMLNPGRILSRSQIYERVWGFDFGYGSHSLDVYVGYLRRKTEAGGRRRLIQTVRGLGYTLRAG